MRAGSGSRVRSAMASIGVNACTAAGETIMGLVHDRSRHEALRMQWARAEEVPGIGLDAIIWRKWCTCMCPRGLG